MSIDFNFKKDDFYSNCLLASIAHAIMISQYPELSNEHSWDGYNYNVQDNNGIRGTITFLEQYCIGAFRDDNSERLNNLSILLPADKLFTSAPEKILEIAKNDTLQYLLENVNSKIVPLITTSFWCIENDFYSNDSIEKMHSNGLSILENQLLNYNESLSKWIDYYQMSHEQVNLLMTLHSKKISNPDKKIILTNDEKKQIGTFILEETIESFKEIRIYLD